MPQAAIAIGVLRQILLVIGLGIVEGRRLQDFGGNAAQAGLVQLGLEACLTGFGCAQLSLVLAVDRRAILGALVIALTHALSRVVCLPEHLEQRLEAGLLRVEQHQHHLGMPGQAGADLLVGGVGGKAAGVADRRAEHARLLPEAPLGTPEAAQAEYCLLQAGREGRFDRVAVDIVGVGHRQRLGTTGQSLLGSGKGVLVDENLGTQNHVGLLEVGR